MRLLPTLITCLVLLTKTSPAQEYLLQSLNQFKPMNGDALLTGMPAPFSLAADPDGNLYVGTAGMILRIDPAGRQERIAGNGEPGHEGDGGPAINALVAPSFMSFAGGSLYFGDAKRVRKIDIARGIVNSVAGHEQPSCDAGASTSASGFSGFAVDAAGNVFVSEFYANRVRRYDAATGAVTVVVRPPLSPDGSDHTAIYGPGPVAIDHAGNLLVADYERVWRVDATGLTSRVGVTSPLTNSIDPAGNPDLYARFRDIIGLAVDRDGNVLVAARGDQRLWKIDAGSGTVTVVAGIGSPSEAGDGGPATAAAIGNISTLCIEPQTGAIYISAAHGSAIRRIDAEGVIARFAGTGSATYTGDTGPVSGGRFLEPHYVAVDSRGNIYISDSGNNRVRRIDRVKGVITTFAGTGVPGFNGDNQPAHFAQLNYPRGLAIDSADNLYIADKGNFRVRKIDGATGRISTIAGNGTDGISGDNGRATDAQLRAPNGLAVDRNGNLYFTDDAAVRIRKVDPSGIITTIAWAGAAFWAPGGLAVTDDALYISDPPGSDVFKYDLKTAALTRAAGIGRSGTGEDGVPATSSSLSFPTGLAVDASGNLLIAESGSGRIRKVDASSGIVSTLTVSTMTEGATSSSRNYLNWPIGIAVGPSGTLYVTARFAGQAYILSPRGDNACAVDSPSRIVVPPDGGSYTISVESTHPSCFWSASRVPAWVVLDRLSGFSSETLTLAIPANSGLPRRGSLTIRGRTTEITQGAFAPVLAVSKAHTASYFVRGQRDAEYTLQVCNSGGPTSAPVEIKEEIPAGAQLAQIYGANWTCVQNTCSRADTLMPNSVYPPIRVVLSILDAAPDVLTNSVTVTGGGSPPATAADHANVRDLTAPVLMSPANGAAGVSVNPTLSWSAASGASFFDLSLQCPADRKAERAESTRSTSYTFDSPLRYNTTYHWSATAHNGQISKRSEVWTFTTVGPPNGFPWISTGGIVNGASFRQGIMAGSWVSLFGSDLAGTSRTWRPEEIVNGVLPTQLDDVTVTVGGVPAAISYISPNQINFQMPDLNGAFVPVVVSRSSGSATWIAPNYSTAPGFFFNDHAGRKYVAARHADGSPIGPSGVAGASPARPDEVIELYGTGFGRTIPQVPVGRVVTSPAPLAAWGLTVSIGGLKAEVQFAGITMAGVWQINARVPANVPPGDASVFATVDGQSSQTDAFIPVAY